MSAIQISALESGLVQWVKQTTGLDDAHVLFAGQQAPAPAGTYVLLRLRTSRANGFDWVDVENNPSPSAGAEVLYKARGTRRLTVDVECRAPGNATGSGSPASILNDFLAGAYLPSVASILAGVAGISDYSDVTGSDDLIDSMQLEPVARCQVELWITSEVAETGTYIEFVQMTATETVVGGATLPDSTFQVGV